MKSDFAKIVYCAAILAAGCAAEELLPKFLGAGFPVLLAATVFLSARSGIFAAVAFAIAAGAAEDAVSSLPVATSACFFTLAALFAISPPSPCCRTPSTSCGSGYGFPASARECSRA